VYLRGIDNTEIIHTVHERLAPMIPATNGLRIIRELTNVLALSPRRRRDAPGAESPALRSRRNAQMGSTAGSTKARASEW